jgi:hypothetical protein
MSCLGSISAAVHSSIGQVAVGSAFAISQSTRTEVARLVMSVGAVQAGAGLPLLGVPPRWSLPCSES